MTFIPPDQNARDRIRSDLTTNMLVEAGAGSGKTTSLVGRMVQHVRTGTPVERLAAVTFTRKAANELRERFRNQLESELQRAEAGSEQQIYFASALHDLDRAFLGTIHSFCGRMLREHPLEAGLDPTFQELSGDDMQLLERSFWRRWIDREERSNNPNIAAARGVGIDPAALFEGFQCVRTYPDVRFDAADSPLPETSRCRSLIEGLLADAAERRPLNSPEGGWDALMTLTRRLDRSRKTADWSNPVAFLSAVETVTASSCKITQIRWGSGKEEKQAAKRLSEAFTDLADGELATMVRAWREHRYAIVMRLLQQAASDFESERHATGQLGFEDLLLLTARLLRDHPATRDELGARYAHLLVDEFQDTDPVQAEVCFLLSSPSSEGSDWRTVTSRAGSLFVVGDPKQSIYRFRRADIGVYEFVKRRIAATGATLALVSNFRSTGPVGALVNAHFSAAFGPAATREQAAYSTMHTVKSHERSAVSYYQFELLRGSGGKDVVVQTDAALVSSLIAERIEQGSAAPGDFLVLTRGKAPVTAYARALAGQNIAATTTGATLPQEHELRELMVVLRAIADPDNSVKVVAALEGLFFGLSPADLWDGKQAGLHFVMSHRPSDDAQKVGQALSRLHGWWIVSQRQPVDVLLERILDETGLLFHASSQPLGDARAGALLHVVETLRAASIAGSGGVTAAVERLESLLDEALDDISLRPGRSDAVRVMNVHQAKGLEAPIVILAAPVDQYEFLPRSHIRREADGSASGGLCLGYRNGMQFVTLAQCAGWEEMQRAETVFGEAEDVRLLYVAATRAERELIVSRYEEVQKSKNKPDSSTWRPLAPVMEKVGRPIEIMPRPVKGRQRVERTAASIMADVRAAADAVEQARTSSLTVQTVTASAKATEEIEPYVLRKASGGRGTAWGRAVHRVIEAFVRGRRDGGLAAFAGAVAKDELLMDALSAELQGFAATIATTPWGKAIISGAPSTPELSVMRHAPGDGTGVITEGVIDLATRTADGWEIVDWKTDSVEGAEWDRRKEQYERQVGAYGSILRELSGMNATTRIERVT